MPNIPPLEDAMGTIKIPLNHFSDIRSVLRNRSMASILRSKAFIKLGNTIISKTISKDGHSGFLKFNYKKKKLMFYYDSEGSLADTIGMIMDEFIVEESNLVNVKDKDVVDIGAYVADTAICYYANGARHVYAFEPYPNLYRKALRNISANKLSRFITMENAACASENGEIIMDKKASNFSRVNLSSKRKQSGKKIKIRSLESIVKENDLNDAVLKIDCEGCEYNLLLKTDSKILRRFSKMQIEYHYGYKNLVGRLEELGFKVKVTKPIKKYNFATRSVMVVGFINAKR